MAKNLDRYRGMYEKGRRVVGLDTPTPAWVGAWTAERASQFMPFAALKGFEDFIEQEGAYVEPRPGFDAELAMAMNQAVAVLVRGDSVAVTVYAEGEGQRTVVGKVTDLALELGWLEVDYWRIPLGVVDNLVKLER